MDKSFYPTFYWVYGYLSMLEVMLINVIKRGLMTHKQRMPHDCHSWGVKYIDHVIAGNRDGIQPNGPYPPYLRMADRVLLAGHPKFFPVIISTGLIRWREILRAQLSTQHKICTPRLPSPNVLLALYPK